MSAGEALVNRRTEGPSRWGVEWSFPLVCPAILPCEPPEGENCPQDGQSRMLAHPADLRRRGCHQAAALPRRTTNCAEPAASTGPNTTIGHGGTVPCEADLSVPSRRLPAA